MHFFIIS